jgi:hypothetical protein
MHTLKQVSRWLHPTRLRLLVQWGFLAWCIVIGIQFGLFVKHFTSYGQAPLHARPPGVEGFLPIGALVSLKHWVVNGGLDPVHPAALVLFLTFIALALLTKNSFCSWLCPVGTLEDGLWRLGRKLTNRTFTVWPWLDRLLRTTKYLLLLFFLKLIVVDMPAAALQGFLASPYWAVADVRMLSFFTAPSTLTLGVVAVLTVLSLFYRNAWCRYLCPYGALLGLLSLLSPLKVRRQAKSCIDCRRCTDGCPGRISVHAKTTVRHVECMGCLTCVANCPVPATLEMRPPFWRQPLPGWGFALVVVLVFTAGVGTGILGGHWESSLSYRDYQFLIPNADRLGF